MTFPVFQFFSDFTLLLLSRSFLTEYTDSLWNKRYRTILNQFGMFEEHENNVVLNENSVEGKPCINRESNSNEIII